MQEYYEKDDDNPKKDSLKFQQRETRITDEERMLNEIEQMASPSKEKRKKQPTTITILESDRTEDTKTRGIDDRMSLD